MELSPIWNCSKINEGQVRAYGLDDVIELRDPGSEEGLFKEVLQATKEHQAWLEFMWSPTKPHQVWLLQDWLSQIAT